MKHARLDYQRIQDPSGKIPEDEPVFLLRGQDKFAPALLFQWAINLKNHGGDMAMVDMVINHAKEMFKWQKEHCVKVPDLPESVKNKF